MPWSVPLSLLLPVLPSFSPSSFSHSGCSGSVWNQWTASLGILWHPPGLCPPPPLPLGVHLAASGCPPSFLFSLPPSTHATTHARTHARTHSHTRTHAQHACTHTRMHAHTHVRTHAHKNARTHPRTHPPPLGDPLGLLPPPPLGSAWRPHGARPKAPKALIMCW